jgi:hypothetical protein
MTNIAADVILRLQAIEAGTPNVKPVTHDELVAALRERIGARTNAVLAPKKPATRGRKPKAAKDPSLDGFEAFEL